MPTEASVRVLRIIARLNIGGPAIHATLLTEHLDRLGYETVLVSGTEEEGEGSYLDLRGGAVRDLRRIPELGREIRGLRDLAALWQLVTLIRDVRPVIVHTHTAKAGTLGRLAAWLCRVPIVVHTYHGHVFHGYFSPAKTRVFIAIETWLARRTHRLVTVTETVRQEVLACGIGRPDRFDVVPLGFELSTFVNAASARGRLRAELGITAGAPVVGIVARLAPIKAHERFLAVARRLVDRRPDAQFLIVGDGERRAELEAMAAEAGLTSHVRFLGWRGDLDAVYADLDVVALTSKNEGSPVALIEAMASGRPVVAMRAGGVADVVDHDRTGLLVDQADEAGMADAILALLADPDRAARLGEAGRARVIDTYGADRLVRDIDRLYRRLLTERS